MVAGTTAPDQDRGAAAPALPAAQRTILVVEDEPALLRALRINLRARGYEAVTVRPAGRPWKKRRNENQTR